MSPEERDPAYLWDMLDTARQVQDFVSGHTFDSYLADPMRRRAVERALEVLGEAARRVSDSTKTRHPEIPWRDVVGLRNILTHDYGKVDQEEIWRIATADIPELVRTLETLVPPRTSG